MHGQSVPHLADYVVVCNKMLQTMQAFSRLCIKYDFCACQHELAGVVLTQSNARLVPNLQPRDYSAKARQVLHNNIRIDGDLNKVPVISDSAVADRTRASRCHVRNATALMSARTIAWTEDNRRIRSGLVAGFRARARNARKTHVLQPPLERLKPLCTLREKVKKFQERKKGAHPGAPCLLACCYSSVAGASTP